MISDGYWRNYATQVDDARLLNNWLSHWTDVQRRRAVTTRLSYSLNSCYNRAVEENNLLPLVKLINDLLLRDGKWLETDFQPFSRREVLNLNLNIGTMLRITYQIDREAVEGERVYENNRRNLTHLSWMWGEKKFNDQIALDQELVKNGLVTSLMKVNDANIRRSIHSRFETNMAKDYHQEMKESSKMAA